MHTATSLTLALALLLPGSAGTGMRHPHWPWPVSPTHLLATFRAPASAYGPGHRGVDVWAVPDQVVTSPADATVRFSGMVAGRPVLSLMRPGGVVLTLEPVNSPLSAGAQVAAGQRVGTVARGGHCNERCLHLGVLINEQYVSPLRFFGSGERARLLPRVGYARGCACL